MNRVKPIVAVLARTSACSQPGLCWSCAAALCRGSGGLEVWLRLGPSPPPCRWCLPTGCSAAREAIASRGEALSSGVLRMAEAQGGGAMVGAGRLLWLLAAEWRSVPLEVALC